MLNFLRNLRRAPSTQYFKYAAGEIILVVIGILIALSINNWNDNRKENQKAQKLTDKLKLELEQTIKYFDNTIYGIDYQINFIKDILKIQESGIDSIDLNPPYELSPIFFMTSYSQFVDPPSEIYQTAINDGTFRLLNDNDLTTLLQDFHEGYKLRADQLIEEEYILGREINDYLSKKYSDFFAKKHLTTESEWNNETVKKFLILIAEDGTFRYKLVERIATKKARRSFVIRFRDLMKAQIQKM